MGIFSKWVESLDYKFEILSSCSRHKSPRSTCTSCVEACDKNAIDYHNGIPVIKENVCNECGKCIAACPVQAVAGIFPKRVFQAGFLLADSEMVPTVKELLVYAKKGVKGIVSETELSQEWQQVIEKANEHFKSLGQSPLSITYKRNEAVEERYTRRDLFFAWKKETESLMKEMSPAKWRFNQDDLELPRYYPNHQFAEIQLDLTKCTLCMACQKLCDKNCLEITETGFSISAQTCTACRLCEDICPEKAISIVEQISNFEKVDYLFHTKECTTCNKTFETLSETNEQCVPCEKKSRFLISC